MAESIRKYDPWHDRAVKCVEGLVEEFHQRADIFVPMLAETYRIHFVRSMKRSSFKRMIDYFAVASKHPALTEAQHEQWAKEKKRFEGYASRLKFKEG